MRAPFHRAASILAAVLGLAASAPPGVAQDRPSEEALRDVERLGLRIASYHEAVVRARERFKGPGTDTTEPAQFIVVARNGTWKVIVMRPAPSDAGAGKWQMLMELGFNPKAGEVTTIQRFLPPRQAPADALTLRRAIEVASSLIALRVPGAKAPFLEAAFKEADKTYSVYLQPAPERPAAPRFGSDLHSTVSADGTKVLKSRALHGSGDPVTVQPGAAGEPTLHSHVEGDLPAETDVALVKEHPQLAPHLVLTPHHMFRIDQAGAITYIGPNEVPPVPPGGAR